jgi:hypothetical protein
LPNVIFGRLAAREAFVSREARITQASGSANTIARITKTAYAITLSLFALIAYSSICLF